MDPSLESKFDKSWVEFCKEYGSNPTLYGPIDEIFKGYLKLGETMVAKLKFPAPDTTVKAEDIKATEDYKVRVYHPPGATGNDPVGVYFHGGGFCVGDLEGEDAICRVVAKQNNMVLVSVDYRMAPKHPYPAAIDDCFDAVRWTLANASKLGINKDKLIVIGGSAGGSLSLGVALRLIDEGKSSPLRGVVALVPVTLHPDAVPESLKSKYTAYEENADMTVNTKSAMYGFLDAYNAPKDEKYTYVFNHPRLSELPKTYITECGMDTLRDDARLMRDALKEAGVDLRYEAFPGYPHWSWTFPSEHLKAHSADFLGKKTDAIKWMLS